MQQEVKPGVLAAAAAAESEPLPVAAIKEEVEQTPSGEGRSTRVLRAFCIVDGTTRKGEHGLFRFCLLDRERDMCTVSLCKT